MQQAKDGTIDGAVLALQADLGGLVHATLGWDPFLLAAAPAHPLARGRRRLTVDVLDGARVLLLDDGHCFRDQALELCARAGATETGFRATSLATLVQMASASGGVTLLPSIALAVENRRGQLTVRPSRSPARAARSRWRGGAVPRCARRSPASRTRFAGRCAGYALVTLTISATVVTPCSTFSIAASRSVRMPSVARAVEQVDRRASAAR